MNSSSKIKKDKIVGALLGTIIEYYDYSLYGFSAAIIAAKFFPPADHLTNLTKVFALYAAAYFAKPIGSLIFGHIGDRYGRKLALCLTIIGIAAPTTVIGILPEYAVIGVWSTWILIICRFMQSIFVAGEYDGAAIYVIEHLGPKLQFTASAITRVTGVLGLLSGIGVTNFFNAHIFEDWGWRIPFLLSLPLSLIGLYYRRKLDETPEFKHSRAQNIKSADFIKSIRSQWKNIIMIIFLAGSFGVTYQISIIFMKQYLPMVIPETKIIISTFSVLLVFGFGLMMPVAGILADKVGPMKVVQWSIVGTMVSCLVLFIAINYAMVNLALAGCLGLACSIAPSNALAHSIIINLIPVNERYKIISLGHTIGSMLMSGSASYICLKAMQILNFELFPILYIIFFTIISFLVINLFQHYSSIQQSSQK